MDNYFEHMVKHKKETKATVCVVGIYALAAILTLVMLVLIYGVALALAGNQIGQFAFSIGFVLIAFMWYLAILFTKRFNVEYEYIMTNNFMDIDKIMSKSQRKRVASFDFSEIEICANIKDDAHNDAYKRENSNIKVMDLTGDMSNGGVYFVDFNSEGTRTRVLFQPTSRMIEAARRYNPRLIHVYEDRF